MTDNQKKQADKFWEWFSKNNEKFINLTDNDEETIDTLLDEILANLAPFSEELFVYVGNPTEELNDIIISADGEKDNFAMVKQMVSRAKPVDGWQFTALIPPKEINGIRFDDLIIPIGDLAFSPLINSENVSLVNIVIYIKDYNNRKSHPEFDNAIERILDLILGEECYEYITLTAQKEWKDDTVNTNILELRDYILTKVEAYS
ncbi:hypothetical protein [Olleya sp. R77988]|uniref:hypothetical protein n=1 Tax=Olleya sp. R77988 TaxID=3093875 RepID=UPI0037CA57E4